jgi:hypothetical protein
MQNDKCFLSLCIIILLIFTKVPLIGWMLASICHKTLYSCNLHLDVDLDLSLDVDSIVRGKSSRNIFYRISPSVCTCTLQFKVQVQVEAQDQESSSFATETNYAVFPILK